MATTAIIVGVASAISESARNSYIRYDNGVFYQRTNRGYEVIAAPLGATVAYIPENTFAFYAEGIPYYYYAGVFYTPVDDEYQVVQAPLGAIVNMLPPGATEYRFNGQVYYYLNETYYQPIMTDNGTAYQVVDLR